jgi:ELL-associated factor
VKDSNKKDCVLIIDHETGEITIERLTSQILLKKTRPEKPEKPERGATTSLGVASATSRPLTPLESSNSRKGSPGKTELVHQEVFFF